MMEDTTMKNTQPLTRQAARAANIWFGSLTGSREKVWGAAKLQCGRCKRVFWDRFDLPTDKTLFCPYCGASHYEEIG